MMPTSLPADLDLPPTARTPAVQFRFSEDWLGLSGESYPENAAAFYAPVLAALDAYLAAIDGREIVLDIRLQYFNSSSAKFLLNLLTRLAAIIPANRVTVRWHYDPDDDIMLETGEDFAADLPGLRFDLLPLPV